MIKIIRDYYDVYQVKNGYEVIDNKSFLITRNLILEMKQQGLNCDFNIIIKNPKYQCGYVDLKGLEGLVDFIEIDLVSILKEKLSIELQGISNSDIVTTIGPRRLESFIKYYNKSFTFKQNIIMFNFSINNIDFLYDVDNFVNFILKNIDMVKKIKKDKNRTLYYLYDEIKDLSKQEDFLYFVNNIIYHENIDEFVKSIIYSNIFRNYKKTDKEVIGIPLTYREFDFKIKEDTLKILINKYSTFIEELNLQLIGNKNKISLFDITDNDKLKNSIERATGVLESELNFFIDYLISKMSRLNLNDLNKIEPFVYLLENKFQYLLQDNKQAYRRIYLIKKLIEKTKRLFEMTEEIKNLDSIDKWFSFYTNQYLKIRNEFDEENDILQLLEEIFVDKEVFSKLKFEINKILTDINIRYEEFLYNNYQNIHIQDKGKYSISSVLSKVSQYVDNKTVFFVIDAMKWSVWEIVQDILEELGYSRINDDDFIIALVPTVTSISRLSLFSGNKYKTIIDEKTKGLFSFSYTDEYNHLKRFFKNKNIGYIIGGKEKFNKLISEDLDLYAFIYSESDKVLHGLTDINKDIIYYILKEQLVNIIEKTQSKSDEKFYLVITTDHGTVDVKNSEGINIEKSIVQYLKKYSIDCIVHGKYIRLFSDSMLNDELYDEIYRYFKDTNYFYIIRRQDFDRFFLPKIENDKYNLFYLICKYNYHLKNSTNSSNTHGGFSMDETIIPFAVFTQKETYIKKVDMLLESKLICNTNSKLIVKIVNPNDFDIKNLHFSVKPFINDYVVDYLEKRNSKDVEINLIPQESGTVKVDTCIKYYKFGEEIKITDTKMVEIKEDLKTKISNDIKKSRRLDF